MTEVGIVGLPQSGKSTLMSAVTGAQPAGGDVLHGVIPVPDARVDRLAEIYRPKKTTYATLQITDLACERLEQIGASVMSQRTDAHRSGIISFQIEGRDSTELRQQCLQEGVVLACRAGNLRISPHAYTSDEDIDRLIAALQV